ncbi:MAG: hypothetical protein JWO88_3531, partial [Frankiales bacterium]|nr:hypothetical protein [Frankiales bacterium]
MRTSIELSKLLLVACDQSYFTSLTAPAIGEILKELPDRASNSPIEYLLSGVYRDAPQYLRQTGYKVDQLVDQSKKIGGKAIIYLNDANEVIVSFGGTDGIDAQDWVTNTQNVGWDQWVQLKTGVFDAIANIAGRKNVADAGGIKSINFTGQSLGGALAQYAAFELSRDTRFERFDLKNVSLTTFNGLGAKMALLGPDQGRASEAEIGAFAAKIGQVAHYVVDNDIVSRLGGGHIGSNGQVIKFDWTYLAGKNPGKPLDIVDAHRIETAFYTHVVTGNEFAQGNELNERQRLIQTPSAVKWAGAVGNLLNNETVTPVEAWFRLVAGLGFAASAADSNEVDAVLQAAADAQWRAGRMPSWRRNGLRPLNLGVVSKAVVDTIGGPTLYLGSLLLAVELDPSTRQPEIVSRIASWLRSLKANVDINIATMQAGRAVTLADVNGALAAEPGAFKNLNDRAVARRLQGRVRPGFTPRQSEKIFKDGLRAGAANIAVELAASTSFTELRAKERGQVLAEAENWYWSVAMTGGLGDAAVLAQIDAERLAFWKSDFGVAIAKLNSDYLGSKNSPFALTALATFSEQKSFIEGFLSTLRTGARLLLNALPTAAAEELAQQVRNVSQAIIVTTGRPANPFDNAASDPNSGAVSTATVNEGQLREFTAFLPYDAQAGGQRIRLSLAGAAANTFKLVLGGAETPLGVDGSFSLRIKEGQRAVSFGLRAKDDVD